MAEPFLTEIRLVAFNYAPKGWALCDGQTLQIGQNQAIFALLGTYYGGNGTTTFQLPNLLDRVAVGVGPNFDLGQTGGETTHTLTTSELPSHSHELIGSTAAATTNIPNNAGLGVPPASLGNAYGNGTIPVSMAPQAIAAKGGSQPHENRQPFLAVGFIIALEGIFPSRN